LESVSWQSAHYKEPYASQRKATVPAKLARLGLKSEDRSVRLLDTCCGRGDALSVLLDWGFNSLTGLDATPHPDWKHATAKIHEGDVTAMPFPDASFDVVLNCHSLHHMCTAEGVRKFLSETHRVLVRGGRMHIIDFPGSPQIFVLFHMLHNGIYPPTGGLRNFAQINDEEWSYLLPYLKQWRAVKRELTHAPLRVERWKQRFWLYYLTLVKD
jgi:ubiquinone/menaquinone biosynthesis C-methylase UbiE